MTALEQLLRLGRGRLRSAAGDRTAIYLVDPLPDIVLPIGEAILSPSQASARLGA